MPYLLDAKMVLETVKNDVKYCIYKRSDIPDSFDDSAITYHISMLDFLHRKEIKISEPTTYRIGTSALCVQIIAPLSTFPTNTFLYWAEGGRHITGTALMSKRLELPTYDGEITTYGEFKEKVKGMYRLLLDKKHNSHASRSCGNTV